MPNQNKANKGNQYKIHEQNNCIVFITLLDKIGTIIKYSKEFENMFGYESIEIYNKNIHIIIPVFMQTAHIQMLKYYLNNQKQQQI